METLVGVRRTHIVNVIDPDPLPLPPLPSDLAWTRDLDVNDQNDTDALVDELTAIDTLITDYKTWLRSRSDQATRELVNRYRADPTLAFLILPA